MVGPSKLRAAALLGTVVACTLFATGAMSVEPDHLQGYKIRDLSGLKLPTPHVLSNPFGTGPCELKTARFLLTPAVRDNGDDPNGGQLGSLVCYNAKCSAPLPQTPTKAGTALGQLNLEIKSGRELICLPATVCGDGIVQTGEACDPGLNSQQCGGQTCNSDCTCPSPPTPSCTGQVMVGGATWCLADADLSCDAACASLGKTCDAETINYAGSSGSDLNCEAVLQALGITGSLTNPSAPCASGLGCFVSGSSTYRCVSPNTGCGSASFLIQRACACQ